MNLRDLFADDTGPKVRELEFNKEGHVTPATGFGTIGQLLEDKLPPVVNYGANAVLAGMGLRPLEYVVTSDAARHEGVAQARLGSLFADAQPKTQPEDRTKIKWPCPVCHKLFIRDGRYMRAICPKRLGKKCEKHVGPICDGGLLVCNACAKAADEGLLKTKAKRTEYLAQKGIIEGGEQLALAMGQQGLRPKDHKDVEALGPERDANGYTAAEIYYGRYNCDKCGESPRIGVPCKCPVKIVAAPVESGAQRRKRTEGQRRATVQKAVALEATGDSEGAKALIQTIPREDRPFSTFEERADDMLREIFQTVSLTFIMGKVEEYAKTMPAHLRDAKVRRAK